MRKRALAWVCAWVCGCSGAGQKANVTGAVDPSRPDPGVDAAGTLPSPPVDSAGDAAPEPPPGPKVLLAPTLESKLGCDNVELTFDFDPATRDFNLDHAFWMMWFAERSFFASAPETPVELAQVGFDRYELFVDSDTGLEAYVAGSDESVIVAFRGSNETNDTITDLNFPQDEGAVHGVAGRVHRGFANALAPSFDAITKTVRSFASAGQPIWITGHSLGGAEATLTAARFARAGIQIAPLYAYAAPRAGDAAFAQDAFEKLGGRAYRIVNELDLVPRVPPAAVAAEESARVLPLGQATGAQAVRDLDYRHVGQMMWLEYPAGNDLTVMPVMSDDDDKPYWEQMGKGGTLGALLSNQKQGGRHAQQRHLCRLFAMRNAQNQPVIDPAERDEQEAKAREDNWGLRAIRAVEAWSLVRGKGREPGEGVLVAHPDTGTSEHPELLDHPLGRSPIVWNLARNFVDENADARHDFGALNRIPAHGHGSETSSVIVSPLGCPAGIATGPCVSGAAPAAKLIPLRVSDSVVLVSGDKMAEGVRYAIDAKAHVISISMGGVTPMPALEAAIAEALDAGIIVVAAAGNNVVTVNPCNMEGVVCVAGVTPDLKPWAGSSRGSRVDISGPATEIRYARTTQDDKGKLVYEQGLAQGTSDATALTAAAAALWLSYHERGALLSRYGAEGLPGVFRELIKERAFSTPPDWPTDGSYGPGILDVVKLLEAPLP